MTEHIGNVDGSAAARDIRVGRHIVSDADYRTIFDTANDAIFVHDIETGRILDVNQKMTEMYAVSRDEALRLTVEDFSAGGLYSQDRALEWIAKAVAGTPQLFEWQGRARTGRVFWIEVNLKRVTIGNADRLLAIVRDISVRKEAERLLREAYDELDTRVDERTAQLAAANAELSAAMAERERLMRQVDAERRRLQRAIDHMPEGIFIAEGPDGRVVIANEAARRLLGRDLPTGTAVDREAAALGLFRIDGRLYAPDDLPISRALRGEIVTRQEIVIRRPDESQVTVMVNCAAFDGPDGSRPTAIAIFQDISALKEIDRLKSEFVNLISHDLRNPLTVIWAVAQWFDRAISAGPATRERQHVDVLLRATKQMSSLIDDLVESTRLEGGRLHIDMISVDLADLVKQISQRVGTPDDRGRISVDHAEPMPAVQLDPDRIERAIVNLMGNALKYSPANEPVVVRIRQSGGEAIVSVHDRGVGIPADELPRVFERFYRATTATRAEGLGLGLYITRLIVEAHRGRVWVESTPNLGSTFFIALPI
jgi:two-component system, NtrC family, sensor histidine kinase KinB